MPWDPHLWSVDASMGNVKLAVKKRLITRALGSLGPPELHSNPGSLGFCTWEYWGLFQLTGTRTLELEPDDVDEMLLVTAMALGFPSRPEELCSSSYRLPMMGVLTKKIKKKE